MAKEYLNDNYVPARWEVAYPAKVKSINLATAHASSNAKGEAKSFYRGTVEIANANGVGSQVVQANVNVGAFTTNPTAFDIGADIEFVIPSRVTGKNAGKGGWMSFASAPAFNFADAGFEQDATVSTPEQVAAQVTA